MLTVILIIGAAVALAWPWISEHVQKFRPQEMDGRHIAAAALITAAAVSWATSRPAAGPLPTPAPPAPEAFQLRGKFVGPDAAADAATTAALLEELASEIEFDGMQPEPFLRTGVAFDELRIRARLLLCRGVSLGEKHPRAREAIKAYLEAQLGTSGGPVTPDQRSQWVAAYREVARAAADASR